MDLFTDSTWEQFVPFFSFISMFILMGIIDYLYNEVGIDSKKLMRKDLFALTPSHPAFSIWGIIFGGLGLFTFLNCFNDYSGTFDPIWTSVTFLLMAAWFAVFSLEFYSISSVVLIGSVLSIYQLVLDIPQTLDFMHLGSGYIVGIYWGWLISASLLNIFIFIQQRVLNGSENNFVNSSFIILLFLSHIAIVLLLDIGTLTMCWPVTFVLLWTVQWVLWKKEKLAVNSENWTYLTGFTFAALIVLTTIIRVFLQFDFLEISLELDIIV